MDSQPQSSIPLQERIIPAACSYFNITSTQLLQKDRETESVYRRKICAFLFKENTELTFEGIRKKLNYKERTSIHKHVEQIRIRKNVSTQIRHDIRNITALL